MMKQVSIILIFILSATLSAAQEKSDSVVLKNTQWSYGLTISPQMLFVGGLDLGVYTSVEHQLSPKPVSFILGLDIRNKWFQTNVSNSGLDTRSLKTNYSINVIGYGGVGYTFRSKNKHELNSFYLTGTPYIFTFKETVNTAYIQNTSKNSSLNFHVVLLWSNSTVTKKGKIFNTQFYIPLIAKSFSDELRIMNIKFGLTI